MDFGFWILASTLTREAPLAVVLRGDTTTRGATRARSWRKCYLSTVDRDGRQQSTRPPGVSLLTRKNTAFPNVLLLQEVNILRFRQEVVFWHKKALHLLVFYSCKNSTNFQQSTVDSKWNSIIISIRFYIAVDCRLLRNGLELLDLSSSCRRSLAAMHGTTTTTTTTYFAKVFPRRSTKTIRIFL